MSEEDADGGGRRRRNPVSRFFGYNTRRARHRAGPPPARGRAVAARGLGLGRARRGRRGGASDPVRARGRAARDEPRGTRRAGPTGTGLEARARRGLVTTPAGSRTASGGVRGRGASARGDAPSTAAAARRLVASSRDAMSRSPRSGGRAVTRSGRARRRVRAREPASRDRREEKRVFRRIRGFPKVVITENADRKDRLFFDAVERFSGRRPREPRKHELTHRPLKITDTIHEALVKVPCCCRLADWAARRARRASVPSETRVPGATPRLPRFDAAMRRSSRQPRGGNASTADALPPHGARRRARDPRTRRRRFLTLPL